MQDCLNFYHPEKRPWPNPRLTRTSIIGHTTPTTVRLWFRVSSPGNYWLVVTKNPIPSKGIPEIAESNPTSSPTLLLCTDGETEAIPTIKLCQMTFNPEQDLTQVVDLTELQPNTRYYYGLFPSNDSQSWELGQSEPLSFQTFPDQDTSELTFGIYSCHMPYQEQQLVNLELWDSFYQELKHRQGRFIIAMGDQVYVDGKDELDIWAWLKKVKHQNPTYDDMVSWYRDIYRGYWGMESLQRVLRSFPTYMIWDDHEIFDGWGSYREPELAAQVTNSWKLENPQENLNLARAMFKAATQVYEEYQHSHNPDTGVIGEQPPQPSRQQI
jgi:alkaline phosphatase D